MFSIIVCSIDPAAAERLRQNIAETIGVPHEFLAFDNRNTGRGICSVYNSCARRAQYDLFCFVHEDVLFRTNNWGQILADKLSEPDCGVIGFAGGAIKTREISGWCLNRHDARQNYTQPNSRGNLLKRNYINPGNLDFSPVICLDGLCLITRRAVWEASPFDEHLLTGFHAYDLDFTLAVSMHYRNYVSNRIDVTHLSRGNYSPAWFEALRKLHDKWRDQLPVFVGSRPTEKKIASLERKARQLLILKLLRQRICNPSENLRMTAKFFSHNPHRPEAWKVAYKFFRNGLRSRKTK